ncbi:4-oxalocrotonate tautomerase [Streptomyces sp. 2333.5]|uniref:tautomerase PptA n=1 Tax=Streptomyces TaxID=1883 RepID=UPI00089C57B6|nr:MULTISPECIES: tautomerase PptA [unclassified Streptomyces]PJJ06047.1 4-oxalocrotonate tautomerase [Streptomyces sp. 2333.5]SEE89234.1 4-oxalocrotonate tautomerase [Streptomyces sp. 2314.4]SEF06329.1 4-oxalocrotonate tautomerase [Streptomyces sp. 2112.2]
MPHVNIKHFPVDFTDEQKNQLAEAVTTVVMEHFGVYEGAVSIALEPVAESGWNEAVYVPEITGRQQLLIKAPNYRDN